MFHSPKSRRIRRYSLIGAFAVMLLAVFPIKEASAMWSGDGIEGTANSETSVTDTSNAAPDAVCYKFETTGKPNSEFDTYTKNGGTTVYYSDLAACLREAASNNKYDRIYIIPGTGINFESEKDAWAKTQILLKADATGSEYTIDSRDTFVLPYDGETWGARVDYNNGSDPQFPGKFITTWDGQPTDASIPDQQTYCQIELILDTGVTLNVSGNLYVGGVFGNGAADILDDSNQTVAQGYTSDKYAQISMKSGSKIDVKSGGYLFVEGYVKEYDETEGKHSDGIFIRSGGYFHFPLVIGDWQGTITMALSIYNFSFTGSSEGSFPINFFEFPNAQTKVTLYQGSKSIGFFVMSGVGGTQEAISSTPNVLIHLGDGAEITMDYHPAETATLTTNNETRKVGLTNCDIDNAAYTELKLKGNIAFGRVGFEFSMSGMTVSLSTDEKGLPFSYKYRIELVESGDASKPTSLSVPDGTWIKFLPGSYFKINENCTLTLAAASSKGGGRMIAYSADEYFKTANLPNAPYPKTMKDGSAVGDATFINNGTINVNGSLAGRIQTDTKSGTASLNFSDVDQSHYTISMLEYGDDGNTPIVVNSTGDIDTNLNGTIEDSEKNATFFSTSVSEFISEDNNDYWILNQVLVNYKFDYSSLSDGAKADTNFTSQLKFAVNGSTMRDSSGTNFPVTKGKEFTLTNYYGISHFIIDGVQYNSGQSIVATDDMTVTVVPAADYLVTAQIGASNLTYDTNLSVEVIDSNSSGASYTVLTASATGGGATATCYVSSLSKIIPTATGNTTGVTVEGATQDGNYYSPTGPVTINVGVNQAQPISKISLEVTNTGGTSGDNYYQLAGGSGVKQSFYLEFTIESATLSEIQSVTWTALRAESFSTNSAEENDNSSPNFNASSTVSLPNDTTELDITEEAGTHKLKWTAHLPSKVTDNDVNNGSGSQYFHYYYKLTATVIDVTGASYPVYINNNQDYYLDALNNKGCFAAGTQILMGDGSYEAIENIESSDYIMSFNHETGAYTPVPVLAKIDHGESKYSVLTMHFDNGKEIDIIAGHGFMNMETLKYTTIYEGNVDEYVGKELATYDNGRASSATLISYEIESRTTTSYSLISYKNLNTVAEGLLTVGPNILDHGFVNYFELNEDLTYNQEKMEEDIATYGVYTYEDASAWVDSYELFMAFNGPYLKVAVGKGLVTEAKLIEIIKSYYEMLSSGVVT